jgi:hypothetical protein
MYDSGGWYGFILFGAVVAMLVFAYILSSVSCAQVTTTTGLETAYHVPSGCYVEIEPDRWVPLDAWRDEGGN